jgi:Arf-GAP/coiled-coil/ANK repeat/PH domain-containing protein
MDESQLALQMWNSVSANDKKSAQSYYEVTCQCKFSLGDMPSSSCLTLGKALQLEQPTS